MLDMSDCRAANRLGEGPTAPLVTGSAFCGRRIWRAVLPQNRRQVVPTHGPGEDASLTKIIHVSDEPRTHRRPNFPRILRH